MSVSIRFQGGPRAGQVIELDQERIKFGRDDAKCDVVFEPDQTQVGREHLEIRKDAGRYRLLLNRDNLVLVNGKPALDGEELPASVKIQLGKKGPVLLVETHLRSDLPPTVRHANAPGALTRLSKAESRSGLAVWFALALGTAVVALAVGYILLYRTQKENQEEVISRIELTEEEQQRVTELFDERKVSLDDLAEKLTDLEGNIDDLAPELPDVLRRSTESVYLVLLQDANGNEDAQATAWVLDRERGILATNAHVAEIYEQRRGMTLLVRSTGDQPIDHEVVDVKIHPGYQSWEQIWFEQDPSDLTLGSAETRVDPAGSACDVGLLYVESTENLAPELPLADNATIEQLTALVPVGYVGFPMEGMSLGGVEPERPTPQTHLAYVSAVTDYFGVSSNDQTDRHLVQVALPVTGGASGSPVLNGDGEVVAVISGMNTIGLADFGRIGSSANVNFAQRVDLVRELLSDELDNLQSQRDEVWIAGMNRYYRTLQNAEQENFDEFFENIEGQVTSAIGGGFYLYVKFRALDLDQVEAQPEDEPTMQTYRCTFESGGTVVLAARTNSTDQQISHLGLRAIQSDGTTLDYSLGQQTYDWGSNVVLELPESEFELEATCQVESGDPAELRLLHASTRPRTELEVREALLSEWKKSYEFQAGPDFELEEIFGERRLVLEPGASQQAIEFESLAGESYFLIAIATNPWDDIDMIVMNPDDEILAEDFATDSFPWATVSTEEQESLTAVVQGPEGTVFQFYGYRIIHDE